MYGWIFSNSYYYYSISIQNVFHFFDQNIQLYVYENYKTLQLLLLGLGYQVAIRFVDSSQGHHCLLRLNYKKCSKILISWFTQKLYLKWIIRKPKMQLLRKKPRKKCDTSWKLWSRYLPNFNFGFSLRKMSMYYGKGFPWDGLRAQRLSMRWEFLFAVSFLKK